MTADLQRQAEDAAWSPLRGKSITVGAGTIRGEGDAHGTGWFVRGRLFDVGPVGVLGFGAITKGGGGLGVGGIGLTAGRKLFGSALVGPLRVGDERSMSGGAEVGYHFLFGDPSRPLRWGATPIAAIFAGDSPVLVLGIGVTGYIQTEEEQKR